MRYNIKDNIVKPTTYIYFNTEYEHDNLDDIKEILSYHEDLWIVDHDEGSYKNITQTIDRIIKNTDFLCDGIDPDYIERAFLCADAVIVLGTNVFPNGNIFSFALICFDQDNNSLYIDIVSSHKGVQYAGIMIMNILEEMASILLMDEIHLDSLESSLSFYTKLNYVKKNENFIFKSITDVCSMVKKL